MSPLLKHGHGTEPDAHCLFQDGAPTSIKALQAAGAMTTRGEGLCSRLLETRSKAGFNHQTR